MDADQLLMQQRRYPTRMPDLTKLGFTSVLFPDLDPADGE